MIAGLIDQLGPWIWIIAGLALLTLEILVPGVFLMWFGAAGLVIGALTLLPFADAAWWPWQAQLAAFVVLSLVFALIGHQMFPSRRAGDEASTMNNPLARFVGREAVLTSAIDGGLGRVNLADSTWQVSGQSMPAGTRVRVTGARDGILTVEKV